MSVEVVVVISQVFISSDIKFFEIFNYVKREFSYSKAKTMRIFPLLSVN